MTNLSLGGRVSFVINYTTRILNTEYIPVRETMQSPFEKDTV